MGPPQRSSDLSCRVSRGGREFYTNKGPRSDLPTSNAGTWEAGCSVAALCCLQIRERALAGLSCAGRASSPGRGHDLFIRAPRAAALHLQRRPGAGRAGGLGSATRASLFLRHYDPRRHAPEGARFRLPAFGRFGHVPSPPCGRSRRLFPPEKAKAPNAAERAAAHRAAHAKRKGKAERRSRPARAPAGYEPVRRRELYSNTILRWPGQSEPDALEDAPSGPTSARVHSALSTARARTQSVRRALPTPRARWSPPIARAPLATFWPSWRPHRPAAYPPACCPRRPPRRRASSWQTGRIWLPRARPWAPTI